MSQKAWTTGELIEHLQMYHPETKLFLVDADTGWTIPKFEVIFDSVDRDVIINPCDYNEMISGMERP